MEFFARAVGEKYECLLLSDNQDVVWHLRAPENLIDYWRIGFEKWVVQEPEKLSILISSVNEIDALWEVIHLTQRAAVGYTDVPLTFLKLLAALVSVLPNKDSENRFQSLISKIQGILIENRKLNLYLAVLEKKYTYGIVVNDDESIPLSFIDNSPEHTDGIPVDWWNLWLIHNYESDTNEPTSLVQNKTNPKIILNILTNLDLLDAIVNHQGSKNGSSTKDYFRLNSWANFLKAAIKFLEETQDRHFVPFRRRRLVELYSLVVQDELVDLEEQKLYLERIFSQREISPDEKYELLMGVVLPDLREDAIRNILFLPRLTAAIGAISQYYLRRYDLDNAIQPWKFSTGLDRNRLLQLLISFYRKPYIYPLIGLLSTTISLLPCFWPTSAWIINISWGISSSYVFLTLFLSVISILTILSRFFTSKGLDYIDLFLPRLFGAIVVGLSILVFESTVWDATINMKWINWLLLSLSAYCGSLIYFFFDIHKSTRLISFVSQTGLENGKPGDPSIRYSLRMAWKIFWIGLAESFSVTFLVTVIMAHAIVFDNLKYIKMVPWNKVSNVSNWLMSQDGVLGFAWQFGSSALFVYLPKVIILWTGLALLIGAFVQLLWQDQQITSS